MSKQVNPPICDYCGNPSVLIPSKEIYKEDFGPLYICRPCNAYVRCHEGSIVPLGRLANAALRQLKSRLHAKFDPIWKNKVEEAIKVKGFAPKGIRHHERSHAYRKLAKQLGIPLSQCHFALFDESTCRKALEILANAEQK